MTLTSGSRLGPYEIVAPLGAGGMGEVWRARDTRLNRAVAIKILPEPFASDSDRVARFSREAQALASLNHPHIAQIYGIEESFPATAGQPARAIVMELVEGETLANRLAHGPLPLDDAVSIARHIADALEAAHNQGIVHRDLKPANIKLTPDGTVKVLDFGLAKTVPAVARGAGSASGATGDVTVTSPAVTHAGMILGTAAYMAPEQAKGRLVDKRADLWAFGCVLYEMLTGRRAFDGDDVSEVLANVLKAEPVWTRLPPLPDAVQSLLRGCLEKDPQKRVGDAAVARFVLGGATAGVAARAPRTRLRWLRVACAIAATAMATYGATRLMDPSVPVLPLRFSIVPDPAAPLVAPANREIAISPDGRVLVYATAVDGVGRLVMRRLDELEGVVMQGTEGATSPFFSPDGRWVGFFTGFAGRTVKKVALAGGAAITLCAVTTTPSGGAWHGDVVYFATIDRNDGILTVPAAGGEPTVLTKPDMARGEGDHLFPFVLPSGLVLFTIESAAAADAAEPTHQVAVFDPRTRETRALVSGTQPQYVAPGILLFVSGRTLRAARFDPVAGRLTSEPVGVVEQVWVSPSGSANYAVSEAGTLVYVRGDSSTAIVRRSLVWVDRDGRETPVPGEHRPFADPRVSPDGQRIVVEVADIPDDIWVLDANRGASTRLTLDRGQDETPVWMPDGRSVAYASTRAGVGNTVYRRRVDGVGGEELLWTGEGHAHVEAVTPDGKALLVNVRIAGGAPDLMLLPLDGSATLKPLLKTPFAEYGARLSPNGRWLAYTANDTGRDEVFVRAFPSLEGKVAVSTNGGSTPVWSSSGDELFFRGPRGQGMLAARVKSGTEFVVSATEQLFDATYAAKGSFHTPYDVDRDSRFLVVKNVQAAESAEPRVVTGVLHWLKELNTRLQ